MENSAFNDYELNIVYILPSLQHVHCLTILNTLYKYPKIIFVS